MAHVCVSTLSQDKDIVDTYVLHVIRNLLNRHGDCESKEVLETLPCTRACALPQLFALPLVWPLKLHKPQPTLVT